MWEQCIASLHHLVRCLQDYSSEAIPHYIARHHNIKTVFKNICFIFLECKKKYISFKSYSTSHLKDRFHEKLWLHSGHHMNDVTMKANGITKLPIMYMEIFVISDGAQFVWQYSLVLMQSYVCCSILKNSFNINRPFFGRQKLYLWYIRTTSLQYIFKKWWMNLTEKKN